MSQDNNQTELNTIEEALEDLKTGKCIIVVDDEDRENEGDLVCAGELCTEELINFMVNFWSYKKMRRLFKKKIFFFMVATAIKTVM